MLLSDSRHFLSVQIFDPERANVSHTARASAPPLQLRLLAVGAVDLAHGFEQVNVVVWNSRKVRSFVAKTLSCLLCGCRHSAVSLDLSHPEPPS